MQPICYTMLDDRKSAEGSSLGPLKNENTALFSLHTDPSCTIRLGVRLGKVWASPDDLGRVYGCGKTDQHTKSIEGVTFGAPEKWKYWSFSTFTQWILYNAPGRAIGSSLGLSGWSWPILRPWLDSLEPQFSQNHAPEKLFRPDKRAPAPPWER